MSGTILASAVDPMCDVKEAPRARVQVGGDKITGQDRKTALLRTLIMLLRHVRTLEISNGKGESSSREVSKQEAKNVVVKGE